MVAEVIPLLLDALATFRLSRLVTTDAILNGPRDNLVWRSYQASIPTSKGKIPGVLAEEQGVDLSTPGGWTELAQVDPHVPKLAKLISCRWCASVWIGFGVVIARRWMPRQWAPVAEALALSAVAGLLVGLERE